MTRDKHVKSNKHSQESTKEAEMTSVVYGKIDGFNCDEGCLRSSPK